MIDEIHVRHHLPAGPHYSRDYAENEARRAGWRAVGTDHAAYYLDTVEVVHATDDAGRAWWLTTTRMKLRTTPNPLHAARRAAVAVGARIAR